MFDDCKQAHKIKIKYRHTKFFNFGNVMSIPLYPLGMCIYGHQNILPMNGPAQSMYNYYSNHGHWGHFQGCNGVRADLKLLLDLIVCFNSWTMFGHHTQHWANCFILHIPGCLPSLLHDLGKEQQPCYLKACNHRGYSVHICVINRVTTN